jgi:hypothetical protein
MDISRFSQTTFAPWRSCGGEDLSVDAMALRFENEHA